jgi:hypothetical protein
VSLALKGLPMNSFLYSSSSIDKRQSHFGLLPVLGGKLFNPSSILQKCHSKTPPFASLTNEGGVAQKINEIVGQLVKVCHTPYRAKVHHLVDTCLAALADNHTLQFMNQGLVQKQQQARQNKTKKHFGTARVLKWKKQSRSRKGGRLRNSR